jgi:hypothetical protein
MRESVGKIEQSIDGLGDLKVDVKVLRSDVDRLDADVKTLKSGK